MDWNNVEIDKIGLSTRASNALHRIGVHTVADFLELHPERFWGIPRIGEKTAAELEELQAQIRENGLKNLGDTVVVQTIKRSSFGIDLDGIALSNRTRNALRRQGIHTTADLLKVSREQLECVPQIGEKTIREISEVQQLLKEEKTGSVSSSDKMSLSEDCSLWLENKEQRKWISEYLKQNDKPLRELSGLSARTFNALMRGGIVSLHKAVSSSDSEIHAVRGMGDTSETELKYGLILFFEQNKEEILTWMRSHSSFFSESESEENQERENDEVSLLNTPIAEKQIKEYFCLRDLSVQSLALPERAINALVRAGYQKLSDIIVLKRSDLVAVKGLGEQMIQAIVALMSHYMDQNARQLAAFMNGDMEALYDEECLEELILALFQKDRFEGIGYREIQNRLNLPSEISAERLKEAIGRLIAKKKLEYVDFRCYLVHETFANALKRCPFIGQREKELVYKRLENRTLEELGQEACLTRERIRQIIGKTVSKLRAWYLGESGTDLFDEDYYVYFYQTYAFDKKTGSEWFGLNTQTECYLDIVSSKRENKKLEAALEDEQLDYSLKVKIQNYLNRDKLFIDGQWVEKNKASIENYLVREWCREDVTFDQFVLIYQKFLEQEEIDDPSLQYTEEVYKSRKNKLRGSDFLLWKQNELLRYYDIQSRDFSELLQVLNLESYENIDVTTTHFMELFPDLMDKYDIRDQYELHNLLRKLIPEGSYHNIRFGRMPMIHFGRFDRNSAIFDLIVENSPISAEELCAILHDEYGFNEAVSMGTYLVPFAEYYHQGFYSVDQKEMSPDRRSALSASLDNDFYYLDEVRKQYKLLFADANLEEINPMNLKRMGFSVFSRYVLKNYPSLDAYFTDLLTKEEVTDFAQLRLRYGYVVTFSQSLVTLKRAKEVFEFEPNHLVSIRRIKKLGVSKEDLNAFCNQVYEFVEDRSFNIRSLMEEGFASPLFELGFSDMFYNDILSMDGRFYYSSFYKTTVLSKKKKDIVMSTFLKEVVSENNGIDVYDLISELEHRYGCVVPDRWDLIYSAQQAGCYHDKIMDRLYVSKDAYYKDVYAEEY